MRDRLADRVTDHWLPIGLLLLFMEWLVVSPVKPPADWDIPYVLMKSIYFSYAAGSYVFIRKLGVRNLNLLWGVFCMGLMVSLLSEMSVMAMDSLILMGAVSSIGVLVITLGIHYASVEWKGKNRSLRKEIKTRLETEEDLEERTEELEEAIKKTASLEEVNRMKAQFLSMASHELKTPLAPMIMQVQLFLEGKMGKLNKRQKEGLGMVLKNSERLLRLISDILDISRLEIRSLKFLFELNDLDEAIYHTVETTKYSARDKGISLVYRRKNLPMTVFDRDRITQVVTNLITNAIKFTPGGGRIVVTAARKGDELEVSVKDSGIGIEKADMKKLFRPFSQIDSNITKKYGGTGLGLSISKGIIESHGGRIWAESGGKGKGTTMTFTLPISRQAPKE